MEYAGYRTLLAVQQGMTGEPAEPNWVTVAQVVDLEGPAAESDQIEVSHRDSRWRLYVSGLRDGGEVTFTIIFDPDHVSHDPTQELSMWAYLESGERANFRITFPGVAGVISDAATTATFEAFVSQFSISSPLEAGLTADMTMKISGEVDWAHVAAVDSE